MHYNNLFLANVLPDPDFKYFSKAVVLSLSKIKCEVKLASLIHGYDLIYSGKNGYFFPISAVVDCEADRTPTVALPGWPWAVCR